MWAEKYDRKQLRSEVGLVFQYPEHQLFENDVISDVCFGPMNQGLSREEAEKEAKQALTQVGVKESNFKKSPFELSGGQKKRDSYCRGSCHDPKILILTSPQQGLTRRAGMISWIRSQSFIRCEGNHCSGFPQHGGYCEICGAPHCYESRRSCI